MSISLTAASFPFPTFPPTGPTPQQVQKEFKDLYNYLMTQIQSVVTQVNNLPTPVIPPAPDLSLYATVAAVGSFRDAVTAQFNALAAKIISYQQVQNWGAIAAGAGVLVNINVTGAALGAYVKASMSVDIQGQLLFGYVSSAGVVSVILANRTGSSITLSSTAILYLSVTQT